ncbi:hypothetical protein F4814DRAFT_401420 [Daldinia grandis]|nr:hypothetical protein F4814DRAFT_401420 [Daldinia grandis]
MKAVFRARLFAKCKLCHFLKGSRSPLCAASGFYYLTSRLRAYYVPQLVTFHYTACPFSILSTGFRNMAAKRFATLMLASSALAQTSDMENMSHGSGMSGMSSTASPMSEMPSISQSVGSSTGTSGSYTTAAVSSWTTSVPAEPSTSSPVMANETWTTTGIPMGTGGVMPNATGGGQIPVSGAGAANNILVSPSSYALSLWLTFDPGWPIRCLHSTCRLSTAVKHSPPTDSCLTLTYCGEVRL